MSFNEKNTKHVTQLFHYNLIIFIVLRCLNCFCMVINHLKSMKYIFIIISFINTTLWKLAKLRGITPYITLIPIWLPSHQAFLPNRHFMKDPCNYTLCYYKPSPQGFWFLRLGMVFSCFFNLIFFLACQDFGLHVGLRPHPSHFQKRCYVATCLRVQTGLKIKTKILCPWNYLYRVPYSGDNENISRCRDEHRSVPPESSVIDSSEK